MNSIRPIALVLTLALALPLLVSGCRKYPDGPTISFISKNERVSNSWRTSFIFRNNIDETARYAIYEIVFTKSGTFTWSIMPDGALTPFVLTGTWELASVKEQIKLSYFDQAAGQERLLYMDILRLYEDSMWVSFISEGDNYDLKLIPR